MNTDKFTKYVAVAIVTFISLMVLAITSAVVYKLIMWIIGG